jgi:hypothetical protein
MRREVVTVHFGIILELVDNIETAQIPYDKKYDFCSGYQVLAL